MEENHKPTQEHIEGKIDRKEKKEKGPIGEFYIDGIKYTCWSETIWSKFDVEDVVKVDFVTKTSEYNGKQYTNRNISSMWFADEPEPKFSKTMKQVLQDAGVKVDKLSAPMPVLVSDNLKFKLGGLNYRVKSVELELIEN
jgi:hypothetical protein